MLAKTESNEMSQSLQDASSWSSRTGHRQMYFVQSPSNHDAMDKISCGSSSVASPLHHFYHSSPIHHSHSHESSNSTFSTNSFLKLHHPSFATTLTSWRHVHLSDDDSLIEDDSDEEQDSRILRPYIFAFLVFVLVFATFFIILWTASKWYQPEVHVKSVVFERLNVQSGNDHSGVPTDMLSLNATVKIQYRNPATFFAVHVSSSPLLLHYFELRLGSGQMKQFCQSQKSHRTLFVVVEASQVPLYGGVPPLADARDHMDKVEAPLNLTFEMRSLAHIFGRMVKSTFREKVRCSVTLDGGRLSKRRALDLACVYELY